MKLKRFLALAVSLIMVLSIVPAFSITVGAAAYANGSTFTYDGVTYDVKSDNLVYNGDFSKTTASGDYITFDGWKGGYVNKVHLDLGTVPMADGAGRDSDTSMCYTYTAASGDNSAYITTPNLDGMTGTSWHVYPYNVDAGEGYQFAVISNWFKDSNGAYLKAESGKTYYMTFKMKASSVPSSTTNDVIFGAYTVDGSGYENTPPGKLTSLTSVLNSSITPGYHISAADTWVTMETVATASADGYFAFQNYYAYKWGVMSFTDFEIYEVEAQASSETTIQNALNGLKIDNSTNGENITLPTTATDILGTEVAVTWTSSNTSLITNAGVYANTGTSISTVTLTPSAIFEGATVTGNAITVMVFPKSRAGEQYSTGDAYYEIGTSNIIENAGTAASFEENGEFSLKGWKSDRTDDFSSIDVVNGVDYFVAMEQESGWSKGAELAGTNYTPDGDWSVGTRWHDGVGGLCTFNTVWAVEPGTYYMSFYAKSMSGVTGEKGIWAFFTTEQKFGSAPTDWGTTSQLNRVTTTTEWQKYEYVFDVTESGYIGFYGYNLGQSNNWSYTVKNYFDDFELYTAEEIASYTVTLNIQNSDGEIVKTLSSAALEGDTVTFEGEEFVYAGRYYTYETQTYTNVAADATYTIVATVDETRYAATESYTWNYDTGADCSADIGSTSFSGQSDTIMVINWGNDRQGIINFNVPVVSSQQPASATLTLHLDLNNDAVLTFNVYALPTSKSPKVASAPDTNAGILVGTYTSSSKVASGTVLEIPLTFSDYVDLSEGLTLRLDATSQQAIFYGADKGDKAPVLSDVTYGDITATAVTVNCVDENGSLLQTGTQYFTEFYGYDDELIYPGTEPPVISGYIFKSKSVESGVITLTYVEDTQDDYFFDNITDMDTRFVSLNMLGSHDAFTAGVSETRYDAAGVAQGNEAARNAMTFGSLSTSMSVTQDLTAAGQLQAGARYFDTRLSRSTSDATYLLKTAPHTNGVFYTMHGLLFDEFEPALYSIAQWAATHPGEIIVLDFQEFFDDGDATADSWRDLHTLLTKTGIMEYVTIGNQSLKDVTYGQLTNNGTKCGIVLFGRAVATNASVGKFILRGDTSGAFNGKVYSNYETGLSSTIGSSFSTSYVQAQADYLDQFTAGDHPIYWMFRVMQAQSESTDLLNQAQNDNTSLYSALQSNPEWLTELPVVMVNGVGTNTDEIVSLLKECNVPTVTVNYVSGGTTVYSEVGGLIGTLYTNSGFYDTPLYKLVNDANGEYYVSETFYTNHNTNTITPVISGSTVEVDVTALGNVYTTRLINGVHCVLNANLTDDGANIGLDKFGAFTWGSDHDRIGIAVLDADAAASAYMLTGTEVRKYFNSDAGATKFYAVPLTTYRALDLTNKDNLTALLTDANLVGTLTHGNCGEAATGTLNLVLDSEKMATTAAGGEVVIIGDSVSGLYGLSNDAAIVSGWLVTTDGTETVVANGSTYTLPSEAIVYVEDDTYLYAPGAVPTVTSDMTFVGYTETGLAMVDGAQVRIGYGPDADGKVGSESGLRFITTQNNVETVAGLEGVTVGVVVTAEGGSQAVEIPATMWQTDDNTVFTTALTNLAEGNFNRKFTAYPYVSYTDVLGNEGGAVVSDSSVTRSIYQVAAGLLAKASTDNTDYDQSALESTVLYKVLNAYVNQTGIRLQFNDGDTGLEVYTAREDETAGASYSGDVFFEVTNTSKNGTVYTVTLEPVGDKTTINSYWGDYIRIENNHSKVIKGMDVTTEVSEDGTLTITFDRSLAK